MSILRITFLTACVALLAACGNSKTDRAISGGAIGAGAGAAGAAVLGKDPVAGAVIGGAVGAATGAATDKDNIDIGDPIWK